MSAKALNVSIVSDVMCPWCYIGKRRFEEAVRLLRQQQDIDVRVEYLPFDLNRGHDVGRKGVPMLQYLSSKFGAERVQATIPRMIATGKEVGIAFNYDGVIVSTIDAHRLIHLAGQNGIQAKVAEGLFRAHHEEARNIADIEILGDVYAGAGGDRTEAVTYLQSNKDTDLVRQQQLQAVRDGVSGVPHFNIDGFEVSGGQEPETFLRIFEHVLKNKKA
nr:hypothetical protein HK105_000234 [Polyrhizophydium stewartii]